MTPSDLSFVSSITELEALYGAPPAGSLLKEIDHLSVPYQRFLLASPFFAMATVGPGGADCSPRGDGENAVHVADDRTIHIPDRRGNNRIDSLRNIVEDGRIALLFLVPGIPECLRINGRAQLTTDDELRRSYAVDGKQPATVIIVSIEAVYFQCARAIKRSELWNPERHVDRDAVPTAGQMTKGAQPSDFDAEAYDAALDERQAQTLY